MRDSWLRLECLEDRSLLAVSAGPNIRDLLKPAKDRPRAFYRGNDIYDPENVGFLSTQAEDASGKKCFYFETEVPGNSKQGHEGPAYGTALPQREKDALLEYLKTF